MTSATGHGTMTEDEWRGEVSTIDLEGDERVRALRRRALLAERLLVDLGGAADRDDAAGLLVQALTSVAGSAAAELLLRPDEVDTAQPDRDPSVVLARSRGPAAHGRSEGVGDTDARHRSIDRGRGLELVVDGDAVPPIALDRALTALGVIIDRIENERRLLREARTDGLTGLMNRRAIDERLEAELARLERGGGPLSVLVVDLDGFKLVNDTFGHAAGDRLLVDVARTMRDVARTADDVGRLGGDEFALLLPMTDHDGAEVVARRLSTEVATLAEEVTASVGVATVSPPDVTTSLPTATEVLSMADAAMYEAKRSRDPGVVHADRA